MDGDRTHEKRPSSLECLTLGQVEDRLGDLKRRMEIAITLDMADIVKLRIQEKRRNEFLESLEKGKLFQSIAPGPCKTDSRIHPPSPGLSGASASSPDSRSNQSWTRHECESSLSSDSSSLSSSTCHEQSESSRETPDTPCSSRAHKSTRTAQSAMRMEAIRQLNHIQEVKIRSILQSMRTRMEGESVADDEQPIESKSNCSAVQHLRSSDGSASVYPPDAQSV